MCAKDIVLYRYMYLSQAKIENIHIGRPFTHKAEAVGYPIFYYSIRCVAFNVGDIQYMWCPVSGIKYMVYIYEMIRLPYEFDN